jgi:hypothetical protein
MHGCGLLDGCRPLDYFPDKLGSFACQFSAVLMLLALPILFDLILIHPVHAHDIPAKDTAVCNFPFKPLHEFVRVFPHAKIGKFVPCASAEHQAYYGKTSDKGAARLTVCAQPSAEGVHGLQYFLARILPELFLPDRKNCLASVVKPVK